MGLDCREEIITALAKALNADDGNVEGKGEIITTLFAFKAQEPVVRALDAAVPSTRYAAASALYRQKPHQDRAREIALAWIGDASAPERFLAIHIAAALKLDQALPEVLELLDKVVAGETDLQTTRAIMEALKRFQPDAVVDKVMKVAGDPQQDFRNRIEALKALPQLKETSKEELGRLVLGILSDKDANKILRMNAAGVLRDKDLYDEETDAVLRKVLLDPAEKTGVVQRECLKRLGAHTPLAKLTKLLHRPEVYGHHYFGLRSDVATALAGLHLKDKTTIDILCLRLVDVDPRDKSFIVRREAWCSLWLLTGEMYGIEDRDLFKEPYELPDEIDRSLLFRFNYMRPGITPAMVRHMDRVTPDLDAMKKIRTEYADRWETIQKNRATTAEKED